MLPASLDLAADVALPDEKSVAGRLKAMVSEAMLAQMYSAGLTPRRRPRVGKARMVLRLRLDRLARVAGVAKTRVE